MIGAFWCVSCNKVPMPDCSFVNYYFILFYCLFIFFCGISRGPNSRFEQATLLLSNLIFICFFVFFLLCKIPRECKSRQ